MSSGVIECGILKSISLKNFMCHDNFIVNLKNGLNVITGPNGSGKSAILTALIFAFGGRAVVTNRANNFKDFIKQNRRSASVVIEVANQGSDSYKPEQFGELIIIERKISNTGVSSYKISSQSNQIISRCRDVLIEILNHFNIQVDNPINVLNQENSKTFLNSQDPKLKYKLFMHATNLLELRENYITSQNEENKNSSKLEKKEKSFQMLKEYLDSLNEKVVMTEEFENIDKKIANLKIKKISRQIIDLESEKRNIQDVIYQEENKMKKWKTMEVETEESLKEYESKYNNLMNEAKNFNDELSNICQKKRNFRIQMDEMAENIQKKKNACQNITVNIKSCVSTRDNFQRSFTLNLAQEEKKCSKEEINEKLKFKKKQFSKIEEELSEIKSLLESFTRDNQCLRDDRSKKFEQKTQLEKQINNIKQNINSLKASQKGGINIFGAYNEAVHKKIDEYSKSGRFKHPPLGPIGFLFNITDERWILTVELCLKDLLQSYIVFNFQDKELLSQIFKSVCKPREIPSIITSHFQSTLYNTKSTTPKTKYPTLLDFIKCSTPMVLNVLMDHRNIERIICIERVSEARQVMIPNPPPKVSKAYTVDGDEIVSIRGQSRFYSSRQKTPKILIKDASPVIKDLQEQCNRLELDYQILIKESSKFDSKIKEIESNLNEYCNKEKDLFSKFMILKKEIQKIERELDDPEEADKTSFENEILVLENKIKNFEKSLETHKQELKDMNNKYNEIQEEYEKINSHIEQEKQKTDRIQEESDNQLKSIAKLNDSYTKIKENIRKIRTKVSAEKEKISERESSINKLMTEIGSENVMAVTETVEEVEFEIRQLEKNAKTFKIDQAEAKKIREERDRVLENYNKQKNKIKDLNHLLKKLHKTLNQRLDDFLKMRGYIATMVDNDFKSMLHRRNYNGVLVFDHDNQKLEIKVSVFGDTSQSHNTKSLSGGERSFSTLSFVISLWKATDSPFRCLDEFDVFMDVVNRKTCLNMLIDFSKIHLDKQVILITPQDVSEFSSAPVVTVIKMDEPR